MNFALECHGTIFTNPRYCLTRDIFYLRHKIMQNYRKGSTLSCPFRGFKETLKQNRSKEFKSLKKTLLQGSLNIFLKAGFIFFLLSFSRTSMRKKRLRSMWDILKFIELNDLCI